VQNTGISWSRWRRGAKAALVFCSGAVVGVGSARFWEETLKSADAAEVVRVRGVDISEKAAPQPTPSEPAPVERQGASTRQVARAALAVTVWIRGEGVYGAGVAISEEHVLTCFHVVEKMKRVRVSSADGSVSNAQVVAEDRELDLAVLKLATPRQTHAKVAPVSELEMGDPVFAMGSPRKMGFSLTSGIVSYAGRRYSNVYYVQTDIPTNGGSSGGPVLDEQGRVVGISSFILRDSQGLAFALPIDYAYRRFQGYFAESLELSSFAAWLGARSAAGCAEAAPGTECAAESAAAAERRPAAD
jgi:S1-C subfamily serine protease